MLTHACTYMLTYAYLSIHAYTCLHVHFWGSGVVWGIEWGCCRRPMSCGTRVSQLTPRRPLRRGDGNYTFGVNIRCSGTLEPCPAMKDSGQTFVLVINIVCRVVVILRTASREIFHIHVLWPVPYRRQLSRYRQGWSVKRRKRDNNEAIAFTHRPEDSP